MKNSTPDLFIETISTISGEDFKIFFIRNIEWYLQRDSYHQELGIGIGIDNFVSACKAIYNQDKNSRLGKIIKNIFCSKNLENLLEI